MYIDDDGAVSIIKTWYFPNKAHDHNQIIHTKIYSIKKDSSNKTKGFSIENSTYEMNFERSTLGIHIKAFTKL